MINKAEGSLTPTSLSVHTNEGTYKFEGNARSVIPYIHSFKTFAKGRWLNRELLEVLSKEFGAYSVEYWKAAVKLGHVRINDKIVNERYIIRNSDALVHRTHRHEPPVFGNVTLVGENELVLAVNKPSSMPVHACGGYRYNSLMMILSKEPLITNQPQLYPIHRLDRLTSGLMIFAKSKTIAAELSTLIRDKCTSKTYLARVKGKFAKDLHKLRQLSASSTTLINSIHEEDNDHTVETEPTSKPSSRSNLPSNRKRKAEVAFEEDVVHATAESTVLKASTADELFESPLVGYCFNDDSSEIFIQCPVGVVNHRQGIHACLLTGKQSLSSFKDLGYCSETDTSLIECKLYTGRTHQLRLHLQLVGNPIANDPCYGGTLFYDQPDLFDQAVEMWRQMRAQGYHPLSKPPHLGVSDEDTTLLSAFSTISSSDPGLIADIVASDDEQSSNESADEYLVRTCRYCRDKSTLELESAMHCKCIWLHALKYQCKDLWTFETEWPIWAKSPSFMSKK